MAVRHLLHEKLHGLQRENLGPCVEAVAIP